MNALRRPRPSFLAFLASAVLAVSAGAQPDAPPAPAPAPAPAADANAPADDANAAKPFAPQLEVDATTYVKRSMEQLEKLVAPVALYPDELLAQILPSATSPLDVVKAHQFITKNPKMTEPPAEAVENWDPAVVSLMQFPSVIKLMAEDIKWTTSLGEAVFFQEEHVYDAIQRVRAKADAKGMLADNDKQIRVKEGEAIRIEPSDPQIIYVPQYDPEVIYVDQPQVVYEPLITYAAPVRLGWGLSWAFDWYNYRCVPHHHWYYTWHHHHYNRHYGAARHYGRDRGRHASVRPPGGRPPRPSGWRSPRNRPANWTPPRPSPRLAGNSGNGRPGRDGVRVWKPSRPGTGALRDGSSGGRRGLGGPTATRPGPRQLASKDPTTSSPRAGSRPGSLRTTRPGSSTNRPNLQTARPTARPGARTAGTPRSGAAVGRSATTRPATASGTARSRPGSRIGSSTPRPGNANARVAPSRATQPTTRLRTTQPRPGSRIASRSNPRSSAGRALPTRSATRPKVVQPRPGSRITSQTRSSSTGVRLRSSRLQPAPRAQVKPAYRPSSSQLRSSKLRSAPSRTTYKPSSRSARPSSVRSVPSRKTYRSSPSPRPSRVSKSRAAPSRSVRPSPRSAPTRGRSSSRSSSRSMRSTPSRGSSGRGNSRGGRR